MQHIGELASRSSAHRSAQTATDEERILALRTAFISRFIVLREGRRTRAHRNIEELSWAPETTAEELVMIFRQAFKENGDKMQPVDRDLKRAFAHAQKSVAHFVRQYVDRASLNFKDALNDYERSNRLLFGDDPSDVPRSGGWRLASDVVRKK